MAKAHILPVAPTVCCIKHHKLWQRSISYEKLKLSNTMSSGKGSYLTSSSNSFLLHKTPQALAKAHVLPAAPTLCYWRQTPWACRPRWRGRTWGRGSTGSASAPPAAPAAALHPAARTGPGSLAGSPCLSARPSGWGLGTSSAGHQGQLGKPAATATAQKHDPNTRKVQKTTCKFPPPPPPRVSVLVLSHLKHPCVSVLTPLCLCSCPASLHTPLCPCSYTPVSLFLSASPHTPPVSLFLSASPHTPPVSLFLSCLTSYTPCVSVLTSLCLCSCPASPHTPLCLCSCLPHFIHPLYLCSCLPHFIHPLCLCSCPASPHTPPVSLFLSCLTSYTPCVSVLVLPHLIHPLCLCSYTPCVSLLVLSHLIHPCVSVLVLSSQHGPGCSMEIGAFHCDFDSTADRQKAQTIHMHFVPLKLCFWKKTSCSTDCFGISPE